MAGESFFLYDRTHRELLLYTRGQRRIVPVEKMCIRDSKYCVNRRSHDTRRAAFTPRELAELTIGFYRRHYI